MTVQKEHTSSTGSTLNWLRAAVLGANDGIVSIAGLVFGVAGATTDNTLLFATGVAGIVAGAISMGAGEYVSVSSARDVTEALLEEEMREIEEDPEYEKRQLAEIYKKKGLSAETAERVAEELSAHDAFRAHAEAELKIDPEDLLSPTQAAIASAASFFGGALIPLVAITLPPEDVKLSVAAGSVLLSLVLTGYLSAWVGNANKTRAILRVVVGGALAMSITYGIGLLIGGAVL